MGYDLYLRRKSPEAPVVPEKLTEALAAKGAKPTGPGAYTLQAGEATVAARLAQAEGAPAGLDLEVPYGAPEADFRATLLLAAELGARLDLALLDPQRGAEVTPATAEESVVHWRGANKYAVDTAGVVEDVRRALPVEPQKAMLSARVKVALALLGTVVVAYELFTWLMGNLKPPLPPID